MQKYFPKIAFTFCLFIFSIPAFSQFEVGGFIGIAQYQGDLAENDLEFGETLLSKGLFMRFHVHPSVTIRTSYYNGTISGDDKNSSAANQDRGWRFSAKINEFSAVGEWNIIPINRYGKYGRKFKPHFTPIIFAGLGFTITDPNLFIPADFDLTTLKTTVPEPFNTDNFISVPIGISLRYDFSPFTVLGFEAGSRIIFSDHLDNVSTNGNDGKQDLYVFAGLNLSFYFGQISF